MPRRYRESVPLPDDVDPVAVEAIRAFIYRTIGARGPAARKVREAFQLLCERATIDTRDCIVEEGSLVRALAGLDPADRVEAIDLTIALPRRGARVSVVWHRSDPSKVEVAGGDRVWVLGVARSLDLFVEERRYATAASPVAPEVEVAGGMSREVLVQVLGTVAGSGALALVGAAVAAVLR